MTLTSLSKETHINRPALYELLPKMQRDGVVSQVQKQKRVLYQAEPPAKILVQYKKEQAEVEDKLQELSDQYENQQGDRPVIKYFEGKKGLVFVFDDIAHTLPKGGEFYRYTSHVGDAQPFKDSYYAKMRDVKKLERLAITSEEKAKNKTKKLDRAVKAIPKEFDLFEDNISLVIYGDKTAYVDYSSQTTFIIESPKIARFQEKLFKLLWKKL
jgi:sugar-specific transcriptional regulator TrmB